MEEIELLTSRLKYLMHSPFSVFKADAKALHKYLAEKSGILAECVVTLENDPNRNAEVDLPSYDPTQDAIPRGTEKGNELIAQDHRFKDRTIKRRVDQGCDGCLVVIPVNKIEFSEGGETLSFVVPLNTETQDSLVPSSSHCQDPDQSLPGKQTQKVESDEPEISAHQDSGYLPHIIGLALPVICYCYVYLVAVTAVAVGPAAQRGIPAGEVRRLMANAAVYQGYAQ